MLKQAKKTYKRSQSMIQNGRDWLSLSDQMVKAEKTPFDILYREDIASLRYYPALEENTIVLGKQVIKVEKKKHDIPVVIVPPLAVNMYIYDLFPTRSLVKFLNAKGYKVYMVDWGKPTSRHNRHHLSTYFATMLPNMIAKVREHSGVQKLSLHGWSFGGLFSYSYAALTKDKDIENIVLVGAPCDYHNNGDVGEQYKRISKGLHRLEHRFGWRVHNTKRGYWRIPGVANAIGFKLTNPVGSIRGYTDLLKNLHDREYVANHATNAAFIDRMEAYPGGVVQDFIQFLWTDNVIATKGELPMKNNKSNVSDVTANIFAVGGRGDVVVTSDCLKKVLDLVSSKDKTFIEISGGHMGILGGSKAPEESWIQIDEWLASRSSL